MAAAKYNITIEQGSTFVKQLTVIDKATGLPRDLSQYTARGMIRLMYSDPAPLAVFTFGSLTSDGTILFQLSSVITASLDFSSAIYDIELVEIGTVPENVERIIQGNVYLNREVTK